MAQGLFSSLRRKRRGIISWVIAALVLPLLISLAPQPALSADAALDRAIAESLCGTTAPASQQGQHQDHTQHCILCHSGTMCCTVALPAGGALAAPGRQASAESRLTLYAVHRPSVALRRDGSPPTGPPAFV